MKLPAGKKKRKQRETAKRRKLGTGMQGAVAGRGACVGDTNLAVRAEESWDHLQKRARMGWGKHDGQE